MLNKFLSSDKNQWQVLFSNAGFMMIVRILVSIEEEMDSCLVVRQISSQILWWLVNKILELFWVEIEESQLFCSGEIARFKNITISKKYNPKSYLLNYLKNLQIKF